jgi:hypothetical protein
MLQDFVFTFPKCIFLFSVPLILLLADIPAKYVISLEFPEFCAFFIFYFFIYIYMCVCVCVCVCARARACACACECVRLHAFVGVRVRE